MKLIVLFVAFFLSGMHAFAQDNKVLNSPSNIGSTDLDVALDLLLENDLKAHLAEMNSIHFQKPDNFSLQSATLSSNPLPSQAEYDALMDLYQSTGGANWINNSGWNSANPNIVEYVGNWHGVITDANGHVTYLTLSENNLVGAVPASLENLANLYWLDFRSNSLIGDLEDWLGVFSNLSVLHLANNSFSGPIPQDLGLNTGLTDVYFNRNQLSGSIPANLGNLSNLKWLVLYDNDLTGSIPSEFGNLQNLEYLYLYRNDLSGAIPPTIGNMQSLKFLGLHTNSFSGQVPSSIGNLANLTSLLLQYNQFDGAIPAEMGNLSSLQNLWLHSNSFSGSIPAALGNLTNVHTFYAFENQFSGSIPAQLGGMTNLKYFRLNLNKLSGSIPAELGNLTFLEDMRLDNNQLSGAIPSSLCSLPSLVVFHAHMNQLTGEIPLCLLTDGPGQFMISYNYYYFTDLVNKTQYWTDPYFYSPQFSNPELTTYTVDAVEGVSITTEVGMDLSNSSNYQWFKDGVSVTSPSPDNYTIQTDCPAPSQGTFNDCVGKYVANVTNSGYPTIVLLAMAKEKESTTDSLRISICYLYEFDSEFDSPPVSGDWDNDSREIKVAGPDLGTISGVSWTAMKSSMEIEGVVKNFGIDPFHSETVDNSQQLQKGNNTYNTSGEYSQDENLKLHSPDDLMTSYTYDPSVGITSKTDLSYRVKNKYGIANRLKTINNERNILPYFQFNFATLN